MFERQKSVEETSKVTTRRSNVDDLYHRRTSRESRAPAGVLYVAIQHEKHK
jgi:hypothetical protein